MKNFNAKVEHIVEAADEFCEDHPYLLGYAIES